MSQEHDNTWGIIAAGSGLVDVDDVGVAVALYLLDTPIALPFPIVNRILIGPARKEIKLPSREGQPVGVSHVEVDSRYVAPDLWARLYELAARIHLEIAAPVLPRLPIQL